MNNVALVTCRVLPEPDPDQEPLLQALRDAGIDAEMLPWDDRSRDPGEFGLCVLRSCWDYHLHPGSFLKWIDAAANATRLMNPAAVVRWNHHKGYLAALQSAGVPVIPTVFFERGEEAVLATIMETRRWEDVVVKPSVSASSFRTRRFTRQDVKAGHEFLKELLRDRDTMVQKYIPAVEAEGEKAIVWIDGEFTHAVRKSPRFAGADESVSGAVDIAPAELALAELALSRARAAVKTGASLLYARVDVVPGPGGRPLVSEVELIEPSLFLLQHPPALDRLVEAIGNYALGRTPEPGPAEPEPAEPESAGPGPAAGTTSVPGIAAAKPAGPKSGDRKFGGGRADDRKPGGRKPLGWTPEGRKSGGRKSGGRKPDDRKPGEWKPRGEKPDYRKPGEWKPRSERPDHRKPGEWKPRAGRPDDRKPGGWRSGGPGSGDRRKDEWKPAAERPGYRTVGWKPPGGKPGNREPGVWRPEGPASGYRKPGDWKPVGPKSRTRKPGGWNPAGRKPGDKKQGGWKPAGRRPGGSKPGGRKSGPRKSGGAPSR